MKQWIENLTGNYSSSAKIVDGTLILSLPDARTPVVWRMDLRKTQASALEVREVKDGGFVLVLKTPEGSVSEIAPFERRARALNALMAVSRALAHAEGHLQPANDSSGGAPATPLGAVRPAKRSSGKWVGNVIGLLILLALIFVFFNLGPHPAFDVSGSAGGAAPAAQGDNSNTSAGVPVPADEFLKARP